MGTLEAKIVDDYGQRVLSVLTEGLRKIGAHRRFDNGGTAFMAVSVERIEAHAFSVAHYYVQEGDLMADPEMIFLLRADGAFVPVYFKQANLGIEQMSAEWASRKEGPPLVKLNAKLQADHTAFANTWLRNIADQQNLTEAVEAKKGAGRSEPR